MHSIAELILGYLIFDDEYIRKTIIYLDDEYFEELEEQKVFKII